MQISRSSTQRILSDYLGYSDRASTTKKKASDQYIEEKTVEFHNAITQEVRDHDIPNELIINFDQTKCRYAPATERTYAPVGSHVVKIAGKYEHAEF